MTDNTADEPTRNAHLKSVRWDDAKMASAFANVVNVLSTREEFALLLGTNRTWHVSESEEVVVDLSHRILMTPYAAKRLLILLQNRIDDHEARFGALVI